MTDAKLKDEFRKVANFVESMLPPNPLNKDGDIRFCLIWQDITKPGGPTLLSNSAGKAALAGLLRQVADTMGEAKDVIPG